MTLTLRAFYAAFFKLLLRPSKNKESMRHEWDTAGWKRFFFKLNFTDSLSLDALARNSLLYKLDSQILREVLSPKYKALYFCQEELYAVGKAVSTMRKNNMLAVGIRSHDWSHGGC